MSEVNATVKQGVSEAAYPAPVVGWYATIILALLYWVSILDRFIISLLVDPIKQDLQISDTQFGILHGVAFSVTFALFGLLAGVLADRFNRRRIIFISVTLWSVATAACGMAQNFWHMLVARMGVGAGEAGLNPAATSMISDLFPRDRMTSALAVYTIGSSLGSGCAYLLGGIIIDMVSRSPQLIWPLVGEIRAWQATFFIVGIPGLLLGLLIFTVPEPVRRGVRTAIGQQSLLRSSLGNYHRLFTFMRERWRFFLYHYMGFAIAGICVVGNGVWYPAHMGRTFGWSAGTIGLVFGITLVVAGTLSKLLAGYCVDRMYRRGYRDAQLRWYAGCLLLAGPVCAVATTSSHPVVFISLISLFLVLVAAMPACAAAALNLVTPNELRGTGMAIFSTVNALIGAASGPVLIAAASDLLFDGASIGYGIAVVTMVSCPLGALILWRGFGAMSAAVRAAEQQP